MNTWTILAIALVIVLVVGGTVYGLSTSTNTDKPIVKTSTGCGQCSGQCSETGGCGSPSCGATTGQGCGCGK